MFGQIFIEYRVSWLVALLLFAGRSTGTQVEQPREQEETKYPRGVPCESFLRCSPCSVCSFRACLKRQETKKGNRPERKKQNKPASDRRYPVWCWRCACRRRTLSAPESSAPLR